MEPSASCGARPAATLDDHRGVRLRWSTLTRAPRPDDRPALIEALQKPVAEFVARPHLMETDLEDMFEDVVTTSAPGCGRLGATAIGRWMTVAPWNGELGISARTRTILY